MSAAKSRRRKPLTQLSDSENSDKDDLQEIKTPKSVKNQKRDRMVAALTPQAFRKNSSPSGYVSKVTEKLSSSNMKSPLVAPLLSNFEEWIKLATDNKITARNSWNFALIDYFHDMSLLLDGDSIDFQKASATLDGCIKIYASRVDSIVTETGKLLSGLASSQIRKEDRNLDDNSEKELDDENVNVQRKKSKGLDVHDTTLVKDYSSLQIKNYDLDFNIDPLFQKLAVQTADGGAKGLLLSNLNIDHNSRVIIGTSPEDHLLIQDKTETDEEKQQNDKFVMYFAQKFLDCETQDKWISPLKDYDIYDENVTLSLDKLTSIEQDEECVYENVTEDLPEFDNEDTSAYAEARLAAYDNPHDVTFGQGGNNWMDSQQNFSEFDPLTSLNIDEYRIKYGNEDDDTHMLKFFDHSLRKNWAGPQHWKIKYLKSKKSEKNLTWVAKRRREKAEFFVDFHQKADIQSIFAPGTVSNIIPKSHWKPRSAYILPDDLHFDSREVLKLFIKPSAKISMIRKNASVKQNVLYSNQKVLSTDGVEISHGEENYDETFFQGNIGENEDFAEGNEEFAESRFSNIQDQIQHLSVFSQSQDIHSDEIDPIKYAKITKKVDVEKLKSKLRTCLNSKDTNSFTEAIGRLANLYPQQELNDISFSFCFICLLHLANENDLELNCTDNLKNITIRSITL